MITREVAELPLVTAVERARIANDPRTSEAHRALLQAVPAMNAVQTGGQSARDILPAHVTVAAWNVERCLFPDDTASHLNQIKPDVVLLSEVDHGMSRTGQCHTTEIFAGTLGMSYAFGVEFFELGLGGASERQFCRDDHNARGWHGNAILSIAPISRSAMVRLDDHGHWFGATQARVDPDQVRLGGRMALLAEIATEAGPLGVVSTHLESNADAAHRARQFAVLLDALETFAPDMPVVIGGDLNTGNHMPPDYDWRTETLFRDAEARGYSWEMTADGLTTRPSLITPHPTRKMKLDWLVGRSVTLRANGILPSLDAAGRPLSDHDCVWASIVL